MRQVAFLDYLRHERRFSPLSVVAYQRDLGQFFRYLREAYDLFDPAQVNVSIVRSWLVHLLQQQYSPDSVRRKLVVVKGYFRFLRTRGQVQHNPAIGLYLPKTKRRAPHVVDVQQLRCLLSTANWTDDFSGWRDRALLWLLYGAGLRRAELIALRVMDVDFNEQLLCVRGKGDKTRLLPLLSELKSVLERYMDVRQHMWGASCEALLLTDKGKPLYPMWVYRKVKYYLDQIDSGAPHSPHVLRHSFATHLVERGADINAVKELLGHTSLAATQRYLHPSIAHLRRIYVQAHPRAARAED